MSKLSDYVSQIISGVDLASVPDISNVTITNTAGQNAVILDATTLRAGVMTKAQVDKLNGIADNANNYVHPNYTARNASITMAALTGANVFSDLELSLLSDTQGHVTGASFAYVTRVLTLANLGYTGASNANYYVHPSYTSRNADIDTLPMTGANVISDLDLNLTSDSSGHVTSADFAVSTRVLTLNDLGYTGAVNANYYIHPAYTPRNASAVTGDLTGAAVISKYNLNVTSDAQGHVTAASVAFATRNMTPADIGAAPASAIPSIKSGVITPSFVGASTGGTVSGNLVWVTLGNLVFITGQIKWTTAPTGTAQVQIGNLPFANDYETGFGFSGDQVSGNRSEENGMFLTCYAAATTLRMWNINDAGNREAEIYNYLSAGGSININFCYYSSYAL